MTFGLKQIVAALSLFATAGWANADLVTYNNNEVGTSVLGSIDSWNIPMIGEIITAPSPATSDTLESFSLDVVGTIPKMYAGIALWNGATAGPALYTSAIFNSSYASLTPVTFNTGGVNLTPGQQYVVYLGIEGIAADVNNGLGQLGLGTGSPLNGGVVLGQISENGVLSWAPSAADADLTYSMTFNTTPAAGQVPEPAPLALIGIGMAAAAAATMARKKRA